MLGVIGCERRSNEIDYRGERIKLTKAYADYDDEGPGPVVLADDEADLAAFDRCGVGTGPTSRSSQSPCLAGQRIGV
jgi:hypothetical protein